MKSAHTCLWWEVTWRRESVLKDGVLGEVKGCCFVQDGLGGLPEEVTFAQNLGRSEGGSWVGI